MLGNPACELPRRIGFVMIPKFSMIAFAGAIETLRLANRTSERHLYRYQVFSPDGGPVSASNGIEITPDGGLDEASPLDTIIVCSGIDVQRFRSKAVDSYLRRMARKNAAIGAVCTGSYILARAGLLDGYRCTIHWENLAGFIEEFPRIEIANELFEIDRNRFTCSGGTAAIDLMLNLIGRQHGHTLAAAIADQCMHDRIRDRHDRQRMSLPARLGVRHPKLLAVIELMEQNLEEPLTRTQLAQSAGLSTRQLERLFRKYLVRSPARYYLELRLDRARLLLLQTNMSVIDVALACGFVSASHFSKCYRDFFGRTPRKERGVPAEFESNDGSPAAAAAGAK